MPDTSTNPASSCCAPSAQAQCCEPSAKDACCGTEATAAGGCGCSAGGAETGQELQETVRAKYAAAAQRVLDEGAAACCASNGILTDVQRAVFGEGLYDGAQAELPDAAGFSQVEIEPTHRVHDQAFSAIVRAVKPAG